MGYVVPPDDPTEDGNDCANCSAGETPKYLTVNFSGLIDCINCIYGGGGPNDCYKFLGQALALNNRGFLLAQTVPCTWIRVDNGNFGTDERWNCDLLGQTCTTQWASAPTTPLTITVVKSGPTAIIVSAKLRVADTFFTFTGDVAGVLSRCMEISSVPNQMALPCANWMAGGVLMCRGGLMQIREGNWT